MIWKGCAIIKKLQKVSLVLAVILLLSLASCGGDTSQFGEKPAEEAAKLSSALKSGKPTMVYYFLTT